MKRTYNSLGEKLKNARRNLNLAQEYVASIMGLSRSAISEIENNQRKVDSEELKLFCKIYCLSAEHLLYDESTETVKVFARTFEDLSENDQKEILNFMNFKRQAALLKGDQRNV